RALLKPDSQRSLVQPLGRRHSSDQMPTRLLTTDAGPLPDRGGSSSPASEGTAQGLSVVQPMAADSSLSSDDNKTGKFIPPRKQADDDRLGAFVTDRL